MGTGAGTTTGFVSAGAIGKREAARPGMTTPAAARELARRMVSAASHRVQAAIRVRDYFFEQDRLDSDIL